MCGICGKLLFNGATPPRELISAMADTIRHRGPDDEGVHCAPHIGFGQRRLSIIDLAPNACAPLCNEDETVWLVFNGEIYNFQSLRAELEEKGHRFKTHSDTETIIHLYEEHGIDCLQHLRGMFAFALWDSNKKQLFCARDRLGKKPFCYARTGTTLVFGSEIKAITADPDISVEPNFQAIDLYLTYRWVPSPLTAFDGIERLGPGEYLICDAKGNLKTGRYWQPPAPAWTDATPSEIETEILRQLREAVRLRMISDVPLGAFLSGGIDSGTLVALMAQESSTPVRTFSIGFKDEAFNELPWARKQAEKWDTDHRELIVEPNAAEVLPLLVHHYNEPFADSSALPSYYVSKMTREFVTVALSGDGGDESFAGYDHYTRMCNWDRWGLLPLWLRRAVTAPAQLALSPFSANNTVSRVQRGLTMVGARDLRERFNLNRHILKPQEKDLAYTHHFHSLLASKPPPRDRVANYPFTPGEDSLGWLMRHDQNFYLPDCLQVKMDIASMANSLEVRSPFLDHRFMEFAATIPSGLKHDGKTGKHILKKAVEPFLHPDILTKPKSGFSIPLSHWFREDLAPMLRENLLDERAGKRGLLEPALLRKMVGEHIDGRRDWSNRLWTLLFLELWFREFID